MTTTISVRFVAVTAALAMTALVHGTMLWSFDSVAQASAQQSAVTAKTQATTAPQS